MGASLTLVFPYYENPRMLERQVEVWNTYEGLPVKIILVDDGSPTPATKSACRIPVELYRINQDIPWNGAGARNLGCSQADGWILCCDIDTLIYREDLEKVLSAIDDLTISNVILPQHTSLPESRPLKQRINILAFHKSKFDEIGGYDEDYSGHYGREVTDFYLRLSKVAKPVTLDAKVRTMPRWLIADACTKGLDRDIEHNAALLLSKQAAGFPRPNAGIRFEWEMVE